jgi:hypothetical protein
VTPQPLKPTGARRVGVGFESGEDNRRESAMPKTDANANKMYVGPGGLLKGGGSGRNFTTLSLNKTAVQDAGGFQKARSKRK